MCVSVWLCVVVRMSGVWVFGCVDVCCVDGGLCGEWAWVGRRSKTSTSEHLMVCPPTKLFSFFLAIFWKRNFSFSARCIARCSIRFSLSFSKTCGYRFVVVLLVGHGCGCVGVGV